MKELTEVIGYMKLRIRVEADGSDDVELSVGVQKLSANGTSYPGEQSGEQSGESSGTAEASNLMRVSMRKVVDELSTPYRPYHPFDEENLPAAGEVVPVEIGLWPMALRFHPGEQLSLTISAYTVPSVDSQLGLFGSAIVPIPEDGGTFVLGANVSLTELGGQSLSIPSFVMGQMVTAPSTRNNGNHIFHMGGQYDSSFTCPCQRGSKLLNSLRAICPWRMMERAITVAIQWYHTVL